MKEKTIFERIAHYFDRLEDRVRAGLSRHPIVYTFIGGIAVVLFWRGVWHTADLIPWFDGPVSFVVGAAILLVTGLFVSVFIGDNIIISGLKQENKKFEKHTEEEIIAEEEMVRHIDKELHEIQKDIKEIKDKGKE